jgi:hypothetical protein
VFVCAVGVVVSNLALQTVSPSGSVVVLVALLEFGMAVLGFMQNWVELFSNMLIDGTTCISWLEYANLPGGLAHGAIFVPIMKISIRSKIYVLHKAYQAHETIHCEFLKEYLK